MAYSFKDKTNPITPPDVPPVTPPTMPPVTQPAAFQGQTGGTNGGGGYSYDDFVNAANAAGLLGNFSQYDLDLARAHPEAGLSLLSLKQDWANASTDEARLLANEAANQIRSSYGNYTGGADGSKYYSTGLLPSKIDDMLGQIGSYGPFNYGRDSDYQAALDAIINAPAFSFDYGNQGLYQQALENIANATPFSYSGQAPTYQNRYDAEQQARLDAVLNQPDFSWSKETDPSYGAYAKQYRREGERATANALAQASAASGGRASSYAVNAATQAGDYYATKLSDIIPTLYQQAYDRYMQDYQKRLSNLNAVNNQEQIDYAKYLDQLGQFNTDRSFALDAYNANANQRMNALNALLSDRGQQYNEQSGTYNINAQQRQNALNALSADRDFAYNNYLNDYNMLQTYLGNLQGQDQTEYNRYLDQVAQRQQQQELQRAQIDAILQAGGVPTQALVGTSGYSNEYIDALAAEAARLRTEAESDRYAGYGDYSGLAAEGINTAYLQALQAAELAAKTASNTGGGRSSGGRSNGGTGGNGGSLTTTDQTAVDAFNAGDQSDETIQALLNMGYTQAQLEAAGYTGNYFRGGTNGANGARTSTDSGSRLASFDYDEDEGIFTWAGRRYSNVDELARAINSAHLSMDEKIDLTEKMRRFGFVLDIN